MTVHDERSSDLEINQIMLLRDQGQRLGHVGIACQHQALPYDVAPNLLYRHVENFHPVYQLNQQEAQQLRGLRVRAEETARNCTHAIWMVDAQFTRQRNNVRPIARGMKLQLPYPYESVADDRPVSRHINVKCTDVFVDKNSDGKTETRYAQLLVQNPEVLDFTKSFGLKKDDRVYFFVADEPYQRKHDIETAYQCRPSIVVKRKNGDTVIIEKHGNLTDLVSFDFVSKRPRKDVPQATSLIVNLTQDNRDPNLVFGVAENSSSLFSGKNTFNRAGSSGSQIALRLDGSYSQAPQVSFSCGFGATHLWWAQNLLLEPEQKHILTKNDMLGALDGLLHGKNTSNLWTLNPLAAKSSVWRYIRAA